MCQTYCVVKKVQKTISDFVFLQYFSMFMQMCLDLKGCIRAHSNAFGSGFICLTICVTFALFELFFLDVLDINITNHSKASCKMEQEL